MSLGKITAIEEITNFTAGNRHPAYGTNNARLGMTGMLYALCGGGSYDGYQITTDSHTYLFLIGNGQSCCEDWGYFASEDDLNVFIGKELIDVELTDTTLNTKHAEEIEYLGEGGVQFVTLKCADGSALQFAVYNGHNGYYGHGIIFAKDNEIFLNDVL